MPMYPIYDIHTGEILRVIDCSPAQIEIQIQNGSEAYIEARTPSDTRHSVDIQTKRLIYKDTKQSARDAQGEEFKRGE